MAHNEKLPPLGVYVANNGEDFAKQWQDPGELPIDEFRLFAGSGFRDIEGLGVAPAHEAPSQL